MGKTGEGVALCGALGIEYVEFDVCREIQVQVSNKLVSISETNLVGKTERGHFKANKIRFSPSVFIILFIYLFLAVLGLCCCLGFILVVVNGDYPSCGACASHCGGLSSYRAQSIGLQ